MRAILSSLILIGYIWISYLGIMKFRPWELLKDKYEDTLLKKATPSPYDHIKVSNVEDIRPSTSGTKNEWLRLEAIQRGDAASQHTSQTDAYSALTPEKRIFVDLSPKEVCALDAALSDQNGDAGKSATDAVVVLNDGDVHVETPLHPLGERGKRLTVYIQDQKLILSDNEIEEFLSTFSDHSRGCGETK